MRSIWISIGILFFSIAAGAQELEKQLYSKGFENLMLQESEDSLRIYFEHREFRNPFHSLQYAALLLPDSLQKSVAFIPMHHNQPMAVYSEDGTSVRNLNAQEKQFFREHNNIFEGYRFSFRLHPDFSARFGYFDEPFQTKFNLVLDTRIYLARGLSVRSGVSIPIVNKLDSQDMSVKLAPSMLHYFTQPIDNHFFALSIGTFYYDRYGFDLEYRYAPFDSSWSFGLESGYTGFYWLSEGSFIADPLDDLYAVVDAEYRLPFERLSLKLTAGQFLFADKGVRGDLIKQFDSAEFGLFASTTEDGSTVGFQFAFAIWPGAIFRTKKVELRTTEEFRWEYSYNNEAAAGRRYRIGEPRLSEELRQWK